MRLSPNLSEEELHAHVRERALAVINGTGTAEQFLRWIHDTVGHAGPEMYQDLVEMDCISPLHDAGTGEWFTNSIEAQPLRNWVSASIVKLAQGLDPEPLPSEWSDAII